MHLIRNSLDYASLKERKAIAAALRPIYAAVAAEAAAGALEVCRQPLGRNYPTIVQSWRRTWENVIPFFAFSPKVRRVIYTTKVIESLHMQLRKIIKTRGHFPATRQRQAALVARRNITAGKVRPTREWKMAMSQFALLYGERFINPKN